ncbi:8149_t:CDS:2 [Funneliformis mosseae]|uniref:8149_t:CDS:1 n=1 Tax=Funneliformis mosseae TaxID=27381 RepID=A0A9N8ZPW9_FUNMO|nr:8149_t:CDS:2 [Funneliformis mosseae]
MSRNHVNIRINDFVPNSHHNPISNLPHNDKPISKVAISPLNKYVLTYSQEDKSFVGWHDDSDSNLCKDIESSNWEDISDFKVSDNKIILYEYTGFAKFHDLKHNEDLEIKDKSCDYNHTNFLENGNIVTFKNNSGSTTLNPAVLIYELANNNELTQKAFNILNEKDVRFGGYLSNRMWMMAYGLIFLLDLATFQLQKISLFEKNLNIEQVKFKFSDKLIIMKVVDAHYIYYNIKDQINFPIGKIVDSDCREFEFVGNNDEFMITLSSSNVINIYFWKSSLKGSIGFNKLVEFGDLDKTNHDWRYSIFNDSQNLIKNEENIFMDIDQNFTTIKAKMEVVDDCFIIAASDSENRNNYLMASIFFGCFHLLFEFRQFIWNPYRWLQNFWNFIDLGAYLIPTTTSIIWYKYEDKDITFLVSISCLILEMKFILFFRAFEPFGVYFAIMLGVARKIFSFLFILVLITLSFAHAFMLLLKPKSPFIEEDLGDINEPNNPWNLTDRFFQVFSDGKINRNMTLFKVPDEYTNLFSNYPNSLLAMSIFLTGDGSLFNRWPPEDNKTMIALMIIYSFIIVVFLMNLLIGLLNMAIEEDNDRVTYTVQKAEKLNYFIFFRIISDAGKHGFPD